MKLVRSVGARVFSVTVEADFNRFGFEAVRQNGAKGAEHVSGQFDVMDATGGLVAEVSVRGEIGAVASGLAFVVYLADKSATHEGFEAVIDGGEGEAGHGLAGALKNFVDRGVVAFGEEDGVDDFTLRRDLLAAMGQGLLELLLMVFA